MDFKEDYSDRIELRIINENFTRDIKLAAMNTVGKRNFEGKEMSPTLLKKYLLSEHSPIRTAILEATFIAIYYPTSVHFCRHVHSIPFVTTSREDRTGKARSLDTPVDHMAHWNLQSLIDMMRKRLCPGCCSKDTFNWAKSLKLKMMNSEDEYLRVIGEVLVPNCIYRCGCPEFSKCNIYMGPLKELTFEQLYDLDSRYSAYNEFMNK